MFLLARYLSEKRIKKTLPFLSKEKKILDLGCGDGWLTKYLNSFGYDCVGVDPSIKNNHPFYYGTADNIPFPDNHFDYIIMFEVIEHIQPKCYSEINRVLKSKGKIILSTILPKSDKLIHFLSKIKILSPYITPHINLVKIESLPWKLIKNSRILKVDQFGVFEKE